MKKAVVIATMAVLATSLLLAGSVATVNAAALTKAEAKGSVEVIKNLGGCTIGHWFHSSVESGKWKVEINLVAGTAEVKFDAEVTDLCEPKEIREFQFKSHGTATVGYVDGVLTIENLVGDYTVDGVPFPLGQYPFDKITVNTNDGKVFLDIYQTGTVNLEGDTEKVELKY